jgi:hypothetical protein
MWVGGWVGEGGIVRPWVSVIDVRVFGNESDLVKGVADSGKRRTLAIRSKAIVHELGQPGKSVVWELEPCECEIRARDVCVCVYVCARVCVCVCV